MGLTFFGNASLCYQLDTSLKLDSHSPEGKQV